MFLASLIIGLCLISISYAKYTYETKYINVPLDHFSFFDNRTFKLRYLINDDFWKPSNGPIFFYPGNEGNVDLFAQNTGFIWEAAEKFNALIVFAEQRYYGKSLPCKKSLHLHSNNTFEYYAYLTSQQVLADYVDVVHAVKNHQKSGIANRRRPISKQSNPVIAFGGSVGGVYAAWMRMKYPAVIEGALASGAPIFYYSGLTPCDGFNKALTKVFNDTSSKCEENIEKSWAALRESVKQDNGTFISKNWNLCQPIKSEENVSQLINVLIDVYSAVGMVNYPYPNEFIRPVPANPIKEMCKYLNTSFTDDESLLNSIYKAISVFRNYTRKSKCFDWSTRNFDDVAWDIQSCTEFVSPFCSDGQANMFEPVSWNYTDFREKCYNSYGVISKNKFLEREYGGKDLRHASNIIFSNGLLDPWSSDRVTVKDAPSTVVVDIPDAAHHLDLRAKHENDPPSVKRARMLYVNIFRRWIRNYRKRRNTQRNLIKNNLTVRISSNIFVIGGHFV